MNFEPLLSASPAIQIHAAAAIVAFFLGGVVLFRRKGDRLHRLGGRVWVALMLTVTLSSFFIHTIRLWGPWSPIHLLSIATIAALAYSLWMIRHRRILRHASTMKATYLGALIIAGAFTLLPGRIMNEVFFGGPNPLAGIATLALLVACGGWLALPGMRPTHSRRTPRSLENRHA